MISLFSSIGSASKFTSGIAFSFLLNSEAIMEKVPVIIFFTFKSAEKIKKIKVSNNKPYAAPSTQVIGSDSIHEALHYDNPILDQFQIGGFKLGFWFAQQGSIYFFVLLIFIYIYLMNKLDKKYEDKSGKEN